MLNAQFYGYETEGEPFCEWWNGVQFQSAVRQYRSAKKTGRLEPERADRDYKNSLLWWEAGKEDQGSAALGFPELLPKTEDTANHFQAGIQFPINN